MDWVIQLDCPEDVDTYIHRVGRTARFERGGKALMMLTPSETPFTEKLITRKVPIEKITVKNGKTGSIKQQLNGMCFKFPELKYLGQKVWIVRYLTDCRHFHLMYDRFICKKIKRCLMLKISLLKNMRKH